VFGAPQECIDEAAACPLSAAHQRSLARERKRECGGENFPFRSCPRNCKRRACATEPLERSGKAVTGKDPRARRPAAEAIKAGRGASATIVFFVAPGAI
jgi:hypothetical protein